MIAVVVPCFNEAARLDLPTLAAAIRERPDWTFLFVDDGSTDATLELLEDLRSPNAERVSVLRLPRNEGKGEAVRRGMLAALDSGFEIVAYTDGDISTPFAELERLTDRLDLDSDISVVLGARVRRLGADIRRSTLRHAVGRVYGTVAAIALDAGVYDTQCGAKAFRGTPQLVDALELPFQERWSFDVELLSRLTRNGGSEAWSSIVEEPLRVWHTRDGSKLTPFQAVRSGVELIRIGYRHRRGR